MWSLNQWLMKYQDCLECSEKLFRFNLSGQEKEWESVSHDARQICINYSWIIVWKVLRHSWRLKNLIVKTKSWWKSETDISLISKQFSSFNFFFTNFQSEIKKEKYLFLIKATYNHFKFVLTFLTPLAILDNFDNDDYSPRDLWPLRYWL